MKEYIEREAVMQEFADYVKWCNNSGFAQTPTWNEAVQIVEDAPAADVEEVRHGEWIVDDAASEHCSCCGHKFYISALFAIGGNDEPNCCPNCGAKMDGGAE